MRTSNLGLALLAPLLACLGLLAGCASRKIVVTELDKAILAVQQSMVLSQCRGVKLARDAGTKAEFFVKTAHSLEIGAPSSFAIALKGTGSIEESSTVSVSLSDKDATPSEEDCRKLLAPPPAGAKTFWTYDVLTNKAREMPVEETVLLYDPATNTVESVKREELKQKLGAH